MTFALGMLLYGFGMCLLGFGLGLLVGWLVTWSRAEDKRLEAVSAALKVGRSGGSPEGGISEIPREHGGGIAPW